MSRLDRRIWALLVGGCVVAAAGLVVGLSGGGAAPASRSATATTHQPAGALSGAIPKPAGISKKAWAAMLQATDRVDVARKDCGSERAAAYTDSAHAPGALRLWLLSTSVGVLVCSRNSWYIAGPSATSARLPQDTGSGGAGSDSGAGGSLTSVTFYGSTGPSVRGITFVLTDGRRVHGLVRYGYYAAAWDGTARVRTVEIQRAAKLTTLRLPRSFTPICGPSACGGSSQVSVSQMELTSSITRATG